MSVIDWSGVYAYCLGIASMIILVVWAARYRNDDDDDDDPHCPA